MPAKDDEILVGLARAAPRLKAAIDRLTSKWLSPLLEGRVALPSRDKHFNDAIWGTITLYPWEVALLDTPLFQRLRGVKQTGLAHLVFTGATHDRFTHICGVVEAAQRMMENLTRNAAARSRLDNGSRHPTTPVTDTDRYVIRLAALTHDVGHGPFSHAIEPVLKQHFFNEFEAIEKLLSSKLVNVHGVSASECISVLVVASDPFQSLMSLPLMSKVIDGRTVSNVIVRLIAAIIGASDGTQAGCLGAIISSQVDADKLDYMARDAHYAGLPIEFDTHRLITKLEFLTVEDDVLSKRLYGLGDRVRSYSGNRYSEIGISYGGTGAFEQMLIGRVFLYDRLYHHHKVRTADAMAQRLVHYSIPKGETLDIEALYTPLSDDSLVRALGGKLIVKDRDESGNDIQRNIPSSKKSEHLANAILDRTLYRRAFGFAGRFIAGLHDDTPIVDDDAERETDALPSEEERDAERSRVMDLVNKDLAEFQGRLEAEGEIVETARQLGIAFDDAHILRKQSKALEDVHVIVDMPRSPYPAQITVIACMDDGRLDVPDLFYDPARWAAVYDIQRRTAFIFADPDYRELVSLAARIWFLRKYNCVLDDSADRFSRTDKIVSKEWFDELAKKNVISTKERTYFDKPRLVHVRFRLETRHVPPVWREGTPNFVEAFNNKFDEVLTEGVPALAEQELKAALRCIFRYIQARADDANFVTSLLNNEKELQQDLRRSLRDQGLNDVIEGTKRAGGETDLVYGKRVLIENKLIKEATDDPFGAVERAGLQGRRYVLPTGQRFIITVIGYRSETENGKFSPADSVQVRQLVGVDKPFVEIRVVVRYGDTVPSRAR